MKNLLNLIIGYGVFMIIGTTGASDLGTIGFDQCILRILIAFGYIGFGVLSKKILGCVRIVSVNKRAHRLHNQKETKLQLQIVA